MPDGSTWPVAIDTVRRPRFRVLVNGEAATGCQSVRVESNNHYRADKFSATFSFRADPSIVKVWSGTSADTGNETSQPPLIQIQAVLLPDGISDDQISWQGAVALFTGEVDTAKIGLRKQEITVDGRDLSRRLIDAKTRETFSNKRPHEIAQILAERHGLKADVDATAELAGTYYQLEHDKITLDSFSKTTTEHDLLAFLARQCGFDYYVQDFTLHFKRAVDPRTATPLPLVWSPETPVPSGGTEQAYPSIPVVDLDEDRAWTIAKDVKVVVRVWNSKGKDAQEIVYPPGAKKDAQQFVLPPQPGMSPAAALTYAQGEYANIVRHQRGIGIRMPGEFTMNARSLVRLAGTGTSFDQLYFVDEITREISTQGFSQSARLKNHRTQSETDVG